MARVRWDGDAAGAVRAQEAMTAALAEYTAEANQGVLSAKALESKARAVAELANPQEKYNRKMRELAEAVSKGKVSVDQAAVSAQRYQRELDRAGESGRKAFDPAMLASYAAGLGSVTAVVAAIKQAFTEAEAASQSAADAIFQSLGAVGELGQLGAEGARKALDIQRQLIEGGTVLPTQRAQAADIAANMVNAGLTDDQIQLLVKDLGGAGGLVRAENMTKVGGNLVGLMTQFGETDMRDMTSRVLVAANKTKADLAVTSNNILTFGELASGAGIDLNQAMAGYVASEKGGASPESAAEMQKSFYSQVYRRQLAVDGDLMATLDSIQSKIPKGGTAFDVLGDANAVIGYEALQKNRAVLLQNLADITTPPEGQIRTAGQVMAELSPAARAAQLKGRAEGKEAVVSEDKNAERELLFDAYVAEMNQRGLEAGEGAMTRWLRNRAMATLDVSGMEDKELQSIVDTQGSSLVGDVSPELMAAIKDYLERIANNTDQQKNDAKKRDAVRPE
jgi:hypothetical protein